MLYAPCFTCESFPVSDDLVHQIVNLYHGQRRSQRQRHIVRARDVSSETETYRQRQRLTVRDSDISSETDTCGQTHAYFFKYFEVHNSCVMLTSMSFLACFPVPIYISFLF